jgi:hypothetical protein
MYHSVIKASFFRSQGSFFVPLVPFKGSGKHIEQGEWLRGNDVLAFSGGFLYMKLR